MPNMTHFSQAYAIKANPVARIITELASLGGGLRGTFSSSDMRSNAALGLAPAWRYRPWDLWRLSSLFQPLPACLQGSQLLNGKPPWQPLQMQLNSSPSDVTSPATIASICDITSPTSAAIDTSPVRSSHPSNRWPISAAFCSSAIASLLSPLPLTSLTKPACHWLPREGCLRTPIRLLVLR